MSSLETLYLIMFGCPPPRDYASIVVSLVDLLKPGSIPLVEELIGIGQKDAPDIDSASHFLDTARARSHEIGQELYEIGKSQELRIVWELVRLRLGATASKELEFAWDGIGGTWRP